MFGSMRFGNWILEIGMIVDFSIIKAMMLRMYNLENFSLYCTYFMKGLWEK